MHDVVIQLKMLFYSLYFLYNIADRSDYNMEYILGIDTGGTYTDAVVICENNNQIVSKAKVFTTHDDLSEGIRSCI